MRGRRAGSTWRWVVVCAALCTTLATTSIAAQSRTTPRAGSRNAHAENVVQAARRSFERRPPEWQRLASPCLHYLDEAEAFHNKGVDYFEQASRARSSPEQTRLVRLGNEAIHERTRLINEFWSCTRRMTAGDEFHSQDPPKTEKPPQDPPPDEKGPPIDPKPPFDPGPPYVPPPGSPGLPPESPKTPPPNDPGPWHLPPGFPFPPAEARPPRQPTNPRTPQAPLIVALGDSITAGSALQPNERYPKVLEGLLRADDYTHRVLNSGVDNDTADGARKRLPMILRLKPKILIVAIGANDGKKDRPIPEIEVDISAIIDTAKKSGTRVLLCGFGSTSIVRQDPEYDAQVRAMFQRLADVHQVPFVRNLMSIVWGTKGLTYDGVHPNAEGARTIARQVYVKLRPMLAEANNSR
jgi:acyl-CoA thioesterase I